VIYQDEAWKGEPDQHDFEAHGLKCRIRRVSHSGHLCGYVGVPESHPWFGKGYSDNVPATTAQLEREIDINKMGVISLLCSDVPTTEATRIDLLIDVHGGITYSDKGVEHLDGMWVFGFDCAHAGDLCPVMAEKYGSSGYDTYRDFEYVKRETESLAGQLAGIGAAS
jgi:hypothetical protein